MSDTCLFCRIVRGEIPAAIVAETSTVLAFRDVNPQAPLHALVIPKRHLPSLAAAAADDAVLIGELSLVAASVASEAGYGASGFRTVVNNGDDAGQTVHHLHLHVLAGRTLRWPPG